MTQNPEALARVLDYEFRDIRYLQQALTHRSAGHNNNERLEFLGDAVLGCVVADELFRKFPKASEGDLSRLRATLVKRESLASIARKLDMGDYLQLGPGERKSGGFRRDSILSDALEAVLGAVYLDGGFEACQVRIRKLFREKLDNLPGQSIRKDPKTRLQEYLQSSRHPLPAYEVVDIRGEAHEQFFRVECRVEIDGVDPVFGEGSSRRRAEQVAAEGMLEKLNAN